ncbi:hypothetical protein M1N54_04205 [Thermodesulfovibrionales bacterium]|nr:hypothetical protein [Thermodesulfovibrionales bacterium]
MQKGTVVDLTAKLAIAASKLSLQHGLPMADSVNSSTGLVYDRANSTTGRGAMER